MINELGALDEPDRIPVELGQIDEMIEAIDNTTADAELKHIEESAGKKYLISDADINAFLG
jgi:hypothetical protein